MRPEQQPLAALWAAEAPPRCVWGHARFLGGPVPSAARAVEPGRLVQQHWMQARPEQCCCSAAAPPSPPRT